MKIRRIIFLIGTGSCGILVFAFFGSKYMSNDMSSMMIEHSKTTVTRTALLKPLEFGPYKPAPAESYVVAHTKDLELDIPLPEWTPSCHVFSSLKATPYHAQLQIFIQELETYYGLVNGFQLPIGDVRKGITQYDNDVCNLIKLHPAGLQGIFNQSQQLSWSSSGWIEPLLPPMRHPKFCLEPESLMRLDYLIHDFHALCQKLKPHSRTVLVDIGASLSFHPGQQSPVIQLINLFHKFGFKFDHIYGYEHQPYEPDQVFSNLPEDLDASFHWINVGVTADENSRRNPFTMLMRNYDKDDLIIVKMDVDTPALERELIQQVLDNPKLASLIDHFYFEHHVNQAELKFAWGGDGRINESVGDSLRLFHQVRQKGVPIHFWV